MEDKDLLKLMKTGKYYHLSIKPRRGLPKKVKQKWEYKPRGFWFGIGGSWLKMLLKEKWTGGEFGYDEQNYLYEIDIDKEKMFIINSKKQVKDFSDTFTQGEYKGMDIWQKLEKKYDGFILSRWFKDLCPARKEKPTHENMWCWSLSTTSGVVWNPKAIKSIKLIAKRNKKNGLWYRA